MSNLYLVHHGVTGQKWGIRNGPPYPLKSVSKHDKVYSRNSHNKLPKMSKEEYAKAVYYWEANKEYKPRYNSLTTIYSAMTTNLTTEEKERAIVFQTVGEYDYTAINKGHEQYKLIKEERSRRPVGRPKDIIDDVLSELFGYDWEDYLKNDKR